MSEIRTILRQEMNAQGAISFARFMSIALYCPKVGYYERQPDVIGSRGDFYTSASIGPAFGQLLAWQFAKWSDEFGSEPIVWIESGAHDGSLALAMLEWLGKNRPALLERLTYWIIEPSPTRCEWQKQTLRRDGSRVRWAESLDDDLDGPSTRVCGIIFSNELADAFPIHRVAWDAANRRWFEWGVSWAENDFVWVRLARPSIDIERELGAAGFVFPTALLEVLPDGFIIDLAPSAALWWSNAAERLVRGKLITIDYGGTAEELLRPE